jgi:molybdopterin-guanine dinucleotide biosynthesis protein A
MNDDVFRDAIGIVLAGGRSTRLAPLGLGAGGKASVVLGGESCLGRVCRAVGACVSRVIVVAADGQPLPPLDPGIDVVRDSIPHAGPLAGIRDGLAAASRGATAPRWVVVASCDVPLLVPAVVRLLLRIAVESGARFVVPVVGGHPQVLVAVVALDLAEVIAAHAAVGHGPRAVLDDLLSREPATVRLVAAEDLVAVDPGLDSFVDLDAPDDLVWLESRGIPPSGG